MQNDLVRARDYLEKTHNCVVVEGILSPVADSFRKPDLLTAEHRLKMVELAVRNSTWLRADGWECSQSEWTRTLHVLNHFKKQLERKYGDGPSGIRLMFLCGGDVVEEIVRDFGLVVIARTNSDPMKTVYLIDVLRKHQKNIHVIEDETCPNDISSTRLRTAVRRRESIRYCTDDEVISYIEKNNLYSFSKTTVKCLRPPQPPKRNSSVAMQKIHHLTPSSPLDSSCKVMIIIF
uniref:Cytidyltransferase-like domain-containing protein n=1 Tax=Parascaris equorum TaxID=6256 RepID=A0A914S2C6_PAREQ